MRVLLAALCAVLVSAGSVWDSPLASKVVVFDTEGQPAIAFDGVLGAAGPTIATHGMVGRLVVSKPDVFACNGATTNLVTRLQSLLISNSGMKPVVLMERSSPDLDDAEQCSFEDKVRAVQDAGAAAALIFDYKDEGPVVMGYPHPEGVTIPAVFISHSAGEVLKEALDEGAEPVVMLSSSTTESTAVTKWLSLVRFEFLSFSTGYVMLFLMLLPVGLVNAIASFRRRRRVEQIYTTVYESAEIKDSVKAALPANTEFPEPLNRIRRTWCLKIHSFLLIIFIFYLVEVMYYSAIYEKNVDAVAEEDADDAVSMGIVMVFCAIMKATAFVAVYTLLSSLCACLQCVCSGGCRRSTLRNRAAAPTTNSARSASAGNHYVMLPTGPAMEMVKAQVHAGRPITVSEEAV